MAASAAEPDWNAVFKALSNPTRVAILGWLREPDAHFGPQDQPREEVGVCVKQIQQKAGISQSTASHFMATMQRAGLVSSRRIGQWTYYKREEERFAELARLIGSDL